MREIIIVGLGSFIGGSARHLVNHMTVGISSSARFPFSTLLVNLLGCFLIGLIAGLAEHSSLFTQHLRIFLITGILGGFTTFSAFGLETFSLLRNDRLDLVLINVALSVIGGVAAVWLGIKLAR